MAGGFIWAVLDNMQKNGSSVVLQELDNWFQEEEKLECASNDYGAKRVSSGRPRVEQMMPQLQ